MKFAKISTKSFLAVIVSLSSITVVSLYYLLARVIPFGLLKAEQQEQVAANSAVVLNDIKRQFKVIAASRSADTVVSGFTQSPQVPLSREQIEYWAFFDAEAVIDLSKVRDSDLNIVGNTAQLILPEPELTVTLDLAKSKAISRDSQPLSGFFQDPDLTTKLQIQARSKVLAQLKQEGSLAAEAKESARQTLTNHFAKFGIKLTITYE